MRINSIRQIALRHAAVHRRVNGNSIPTIKHNHQHGRAPISIRVTAHGTQRPLSHDEPLLISDPPQRRTHHRRHAKISRQINTQSQVTLSHDRKIRQRSNNIRTRILTRCIRSAHLHHSHRRGKLNTARSHREISDITRLNRIAVALHGNSTRRFKIHLHRHQMSNQSNSLNRAHSVNICSIRRLPGSCPLNHRQ